MPLQCPHCQSSIVLDGQTPREIVCPSCGSSIQLDDHATIGWLPDEVPQRIGKFLLLEQLGVGSFGSVYKARDSELDRLVAIKIPRSGSVLNQDRERFLREARSAAQLKHPGIVSLYDAGTVDGICCLVSEFIPGVTLAQRLTVKRFSFRQSAELIASVATALHYAHERGVVHRDLKPSNIMLDLENRPHLMDFGLAKRAADEVTVTLDGQVLGTPAYMSPEQARGETQRVDVRSDVYSLGVILYELLTGELPFRGQTRMLIVQLLQDEPRPPRRLNDRIPRDLETICLKAMAKEPGRRYATAADLAEDLRRFLAGEPILARPVSQGEKLWRWCRRNPALAAAAAGITLTLAVASAVSAAFALVAEREADRASRNESIANQKAVEAAIDRDAARAAERESRRRMVRLSIMTGTRSLEAGDPATALLWFHQAWGLDQPETEPSHRARIAGVIQAMPHLIGACFHAHQVTDAVFSPDGRRILARCADNRAYLWDYEQSRLDTAPLVHLLPIRSACWSPDGTAVATASEDGTAAIWDSKSGTQLHTVKHGNPVNWIAYHPAGKQLVTAGDDGRLRLWDATTGAAMDWTVESDAAIDYVAFSPDGSMLVTAGQDNTVRVWSLDSGRAVSPPLPYRAATPTERYSFHFDRWPRFGNDGRSVISFKNDELVIWPGSEQAEIQTISAGYSITEVYPIPGTDWVLATGSRYNRVAVIRLPDGDDVYVLSHPRQANIGAVSGDGQHLITASSGGLIHLRSAATGELRGPPQKCADFASAVAFSPDGKRFLAASQDGTVRVWAVEPHQVTVAPYQPDGSGNLVTLDAAGDRHRTFSPDSQHVIEWSRELVQFKPARSPAPFQPIPRSTDPIDAVYFSNDGSRFVIFGPQSAQAWDARTFEPAGDPVGVATAGRGIGLDRLARLSGDGSRIAVWDDERTVSVWDLVLGRRVFGPARLDDPGDRIFGPPETHGHISALVLSGDGRWLAAVTDSSGALTVWNVEANRVAHHTPKRFQGLAQGFAFSADGRQILLWASDNNARVFDTQTGSPLGPAINPPLASDRYVRIHPNESAISADGAWIAIFDSGQGAVRLYDARWADNLLDVPLPADLLPATDGTRSPISRLWFSRAGDRINFSAGPAAYTVRLPRFDVPVEATAALVRLLTGRRIDHTDGIEQLDPATFRNDPETYGRAFSEWKRTEADR